MDEPALEPREYYISVLTVHHPQSERDRGPVEAGGAPDPLSAQLYKDTNGKGRALMTLLHPVSERSYQL